MPRPDFVQKMKKEIAQQSETVARNQQEKLHDAAILKNEGTKKWEELKQEVENTAREIGIVYELRGAHRFGLGSYTAHLEIRFDPDNGKIVCSDGQTDKIFYPIVNGQDLSYSESPATTSSKLLGAGNLLNMQLLAEALIEKAVTTGRAD